MSKLAADRVARHLVAAGRLIDEDPEAALAQARAARALGARVAVVRQAAGETAYAAGEWAEAIAELRTARRMTGDDSALPLIADAERALGRPDRALRLAQSPEAQSLPPAERAEMRIVEAGARRDLGQLDAALVTLQGPGLDRRTIEPWSARLWYAYADVLLALGREDEARDWFGAAATVDADGSTDADERVLELDGVEILADEDEEADDGRADPRPTDVDETGRTTPCDERPASERPPTRQLADDGADGEAARRMSRARRRQRRVGRGTEATPASADAGDDGRRSEPRPERQLARPTMPPRGGALRRGRLPHGGAGASRRGIGAAGGREDASRGRAGWPGRAPVRAPCRAAAAGRRAARGSACSAGRGRRKCAPDATRSRLLAPAAADASPAAADRRESPATVLAFSDAAADQPPDQSGSSA